MAPRALFTRGGLPPCGSVAMIGFQVLYRSLGAAPLQHRLMSPNTEEVKPAVVIAFDDRTSGDVSCVPTLDPQRGGLSCDVRRDVGWGGSFLQPRLQRHGS